MNASVAEMEIVEVPNMQLNRTAVSAALERALYNARKNRSDLAVDSGIPQSTISDLMNNKQNLTIALAVKLGRVPWLKLSTARLVQLATSGIE
jgi:plasmid maintenance system antidote protein VapI